MKKNYWKAVFLFSMIILIAAFLETMIALNIAFAVTGGPVRALLALSMTILMGLPTGLYLLGKFEKIYARTAEDKKEEQK